MFEQAELASKDKLAHLQAIINRQAAVIEKLEQDYKNASNPTSN